MFPSPCFIIKMVHMEDQRKIYPSIKKINWKINNILKKYLKLLVYLHGQPMIQIH